eukprot:gene6281-12721_t
METNSEANSMTEFMSDIRSSELVTDFLTCHIPGKGNDLQMTERLSSMRNTSIVFVGSSNSGKAAIMESCFTDISKGQENGGQYAKNTLAVLQSLSSVQQSGLFESSRCASSLSCLFNTEGKFLGAHLSILALELFRVATPVISDSDYFIFHDVFTYAPPVVRSLLKFSSLSKFMKSDCADQDRFQSFLQMFNSFGNEYTEGSEIQASFFKLLAAILHLRELSVVEDNETGNVNIGSVNDIADLLGLPAKSIINTLGVRKVHAGRRVSTSEAVNSEEQTKKCRDVVIKQLYRTAVMWFIKQMNKQVEKNEHLAASSLNLIDIPGPEISSTTNSLHQLCRNYMCERIFNTMSQTLFENERALLYSQGLNHLWQDVDAMNGIDTINTFTLNARGILPLLDVQSQLGDAASDKAFLSQMRTAQIGNTIVSKPRFGEDEGFVVKHYFGNVNYTVSGFIEANTESIHKTFSNISALLQKSTNAILKDVFVDNGLLKVVDEDAEEPEPWVVQPLQLMETAAEQYRGDMMMGSRVMMEARILTNALEAADRVHWVVCISPHERYPKNRSFNEQWVRQQLQMYQLEKAVTARKYDFPYRTPLNQFQTLSKDAAFLVTLMSTSPMILGATTPADLVVKMFPTADDYALGSDYVFMRPGSLEKISAYTATIKVKAAAVIQSFARRNAARIKYLACQASAMSLTKAARQYIQRKSIRDQKAAEKASRVIVVQKLSRRLIAVKSFQKRKVKSIGAILKIQSMYRGHRVRVEFLKEINRRLDASTVLGSTTVLRANEKVAMMGLVAKESSWTFIGKRKRVLILTSSHQPRLLYVDGDKKEVRGIIDITDRVSAVCTEDDRRFDVTINEGKVYKFHVLTGAKGWTDAIAKALMEYYPKEDTENSPLPRANRSFSFTSIPSGSPVKMSHMSTSTTPHKSTATFLATSGIKRSGIPRMNLSSMTLTSPARPNSLEGVTKALQFR